MYNAIDTIAEPFRRMWFFALCVKDPTNQFRQGRLLLGSGRRHVDGGRYDHLESHQVCGIAPDSGSPASLFERGCSRSGLVCFVFVISFVFVQSSNKV